VIIVLAQDLDTEFVKSLFEQRMKELTKNSLRSVDVQFSDSWI